MLTEEQIKNLEPGDKVLLEVDFFSSNEEKAYVRIPLADRTGQVCILLAENLYLPPAKPKHDPTRLFKKGDKVRVVEWNGRAFFDRDHQRDLTTGSICVVDEDEEETIAESIRIQEYIPVNVVFDEMIRYVPACYLELVTPVEEQVSFRVGDFSVNGEWCVWKNSLGKTEIISSYKIDTHPNAKEAAQTECDRLNAAYKKEQS